MKYVVDTSAILAGSKYDQYEKEYFLHYWENFDKKVQDGIIVSTERVFKEIEVKDDIITEWANNNEKMFQTPSTPVFNIVASLHRRFPDWYQKNKKKKNWADSQVIAFAKYHDLILVTQEGWNWKAKSNGKFKIPTICSNMGALCHIGEKKDSGIEKHNGFQCIDMLELIKRENLHKINE
jgi:hypothetical protein